jgi:hypothetical protein
MSPCLYAFEHRISGRSILVNNALTQEDDPERLPIANVSPARFQNRTGEGCAMSRAVIAFCVLLALGSSADATKREALVIGTSAYKYPGELANPKNDATDIAAMLKKTGR